MPSPQTKRVMFMVFAFAGAAVFVRLGFWQLHRRQERAARNAVIIARSASPATPVLQLPRDTIENRFRRARVDGAVDYDHELIYAARSLRGSPGVNVLTPVRLAGSDTAILVDRGWAYAPDGATVDSAKMREPGATFVGYVEELPATGGASYTNRPTTIARLSYDVVSKALPYPVFPFYVIALGDSTMSPNRLARLSLPPVDAGPHLSYAIQWFCFATIALVGAAIVWRRGVG